ncbi:MutS-related protein [Mucilaginibacter psychrotolerans]|uniref:DNA mismatch repair protein n=1 Tax=Mucilaginibacter psychrotolerans TaxID=1524096 RepID=A0A4Y8SGK4_9SPHI|nr:DNA mismatch repair protein [Mucilaginibacter psychrotolerans]TFF37765.1 DNA mismatch repair protein [Mucilaginibacter psychrotolerans]
MSFFADKQTLEDLNILGKYKPNSIFSLFNKVHTAGGEKLLQHMFEKPLDNADEINSRVSTFRYFQQHKLSFPFSSEELAVAQSYLSDSGKSSILLSVIYLTGKKILSTLIEDTHYKEIETGLRITIKVLHVCREFLKAFNDESELQKASQGPVKKLKTRLCNPDLVSLLNQAESEIISLFTFAKYDYLLRHLLRSEMNQVITEIFELDVFMAIPQVAKANSFNFPFARPNAENVLDAVQLWHPDVKKAVSNPVTLSQNQNLIFLTGANMAGKSTFMKALGINTYLAHMGFPVAAAEMNFSVKSGIYSSINVSDNLNKGYSHFYSEVIRVKTVASEVAAGRDLVVIFDELFKGTNVKDAYDATLAVTTEFVRYTNCLFIISTHIIEVGEALQLQDNNIQFLYLPTLINGKTPRYTYQLQQGISADRHGMMIIENEGILQMLEDSSPNQPYKL